MASETGKTTVTAEQLDFLRHSLGLNDRGHGTEYRNYFVAGGKDVEVCRSLVALGLMSEGQSATRLCGDLFHVTDEGRAVAKS